MAPSKRPADDADDFIYTISDNEDIPSESDDNGAPRKKPKTRHEPPADVDTFEGPWGKNDPDDVDLGSGFCLLV